MIPATKGQTDTTALVDDSMVSLSYYSKLSTKDAWLADDATTTSGNNVFAYADVAAPQDFSDGDFTAEVTSANTFDHPLKGNQNANSYDNRKAAIVNLFYMNNFLHDFFYDHGFDEKSYVAQQSNYGRGGIEGDPIHAQAQDSSGLNNANMSTPADGASPRMQMYLYDSKDAKVGVDFGATVTTHSDIGLLKSTQVSSFGQKQFQGIKAEAVRLVDGDDSGSVNDGCQAAVNAEELKGKFALIDRGSCSFTTKVKFAQDAGAIGAYVINNTNDGTPAPMGIGRGDPLGPQITIPNFGLNYADGHAIYDKITTGDTVSLEMFNNALLKDGTFDNGIIAHEWGHYIGNRLVGNSSGLSNFQGRAMGEGWGDFHSLMFIAKASDIELEGNDKFQRAYGSGTFVEDFYSGIRRLPYSTDTSINGLSFRHITEGAGADIGIAGTSVASPHAPGEIWATMLWDSYVALINKHGFDTAQKRMADYLVAGYKMTPVSPLYTEARDGILAAALAADKEDYQAILSAFAKRGMGIGAVAPARSSTDLTGVVESNKTELATFNTAEMTFNTNYNGSTVGFCTNDNVLDKGETGTITVSVKNVGSAPLSGVKAKLVVTSGQDVTFANDGEFTFGEIAQFETVASAPIMVTLNESGIAEELKIDVTFPEQATDDAIVEPAKVSLSSTVNLDFTLRAPTNGVDTDTMEDYSYTANWKERVLTGGDRAKGTQKADNGGNIPFFSNFGFDLGKQAMLLSNNGFQSDVVVESENIEVGFGNGLEMNFWHFYALENTYDGGVIEIKVNDGEWKDVTKAGGKFETGYNATSLVTGSSQALQGRPVFTGRNGTIPTSAGGMEKLTFGTDLNGQRVQLRFRVSSDSNSADLGWWIDNVQFKNIASPAFNNVVAGNTGTCDNAAPLLGAIADVTVAESAKGQLAVTATDRNADDTLAYKWTQVSGPDATIADADKATASFTPPAITADTKLVFQVEVTDGKATSSTQVNVTVTNENPAPTTPPPAPSKSSGGSMGLISLLLLPLAMLRRRRR